MHFQYSGMTALHFASKEGHSTICQLLLDKGATAETLDFVSPVWVSDLNKCTTKGVLAGLNVISEFHDIYSRVNSHLNK